MRFLRRLIALFLIPCLLRQGIAVAPAPSGLRSPGPAASLFLETALTQRAVVASDQIEPEAGHLKEIRAGVFEEISEISPAATPVPTERTVDNRRIRDITNDVSLAPDRLPAWNDYEFLPGPLRNTQDPSEELKWLASTLNLDDAASADWELHLVYYPYEKRVDSFNDRVRWGFHYVNHKTRRQVILGTTEINKRYHLLKPRQRHVLFRDFYAANRAANNARWEILRTLRATLQDAAQLEFLLNRPEFEASTQGTRRLALKALARLGTDPDPLYNVKIFQQVAETMTPDGQRMTVLLSPEVITDLWNVIEPFYHPGPAGPAVLAQPNLPAERTLLQELRTWIASAVQLALRGIADGWDAIAPDYSEQAFNLRAATVKMGMLMRFIKFLKNYSIAHDTRINPRADRPRALLPQQIKRIGFVGSACDIEVRALARLKALLPQTGSTPATGMAFEDLEFYNWDFSGEMLEQGRRAIEKELPALGIPVENLKIHHVKQDVVREPLKQADGTLLPDRTLHVVETGIFGSLGDTAEHLQQKAFMLTEMNRVLEKGGYMILSVKSSQIPQALGDTLKRFNFEVLSQQPDMGMSSALLDLLAGDNQAQRERIREHLNGSGYLIAFKTANLTQREADALPATAAVYEKLVYTDVHEPVKAGGRAGSAGKSAAQTVPLTNLRYDLLTDIGLLPEDKILDESSRNADAVPRLLQEGERKKLLEQALIPVLALPTVGRVKKPMDIEGLDKIAKTPSRAQAICLDYGLQNKVSDVLRYLEQKGLIEKQKGAMAKPAASAPGARPRWQSSLAAFVKASGAQKDKQFAWPEWMACEKELELEFVRLPESVRQTQEQALRTDRLFDTRELFSTLNRDYLAPLGWIYIPDGDVFIRIKPRLVSRYSVDRLSHPLFVYEYLSGLDGEVSAIRVSGAGLIHIPQRLAANLKPIADLPKAAFQILANPQLRQMAGEVAGSRMMRMAEAVRDQAKAATGHEGPLSTSELFAPYLELQTRHNLLITSLLSLSEAIGEKTGRHTPGAPLSRPFESDDTAFAEAFIKKESLADGVLSEFLRRPGVDVSDADRLEPADLLWVLCRLAELRDAQNPQELLYLLEAPAFITLTGEINVLDRPDTLFFGFLASRIASPLVAISPRLFDKDGMVKLSAALRAMDPAALRQLADDLIEDNFTTKPTVDGLAIKFIDTDPARPAWLPAAALLRASFAQGYVDRAALRALSSALAPDWGSIPESLYARDACTPHPEASIRENYYRMNDFLEQFNRHYLRPHGIGMAIKPHWTPAGQRWGLVVGLVDPAVARDIPADGGHQAVSLSQFHTILSWTRAPSTYIIADQSAVFDLPVLKSYDETQFPLLADPEPALRARIRSGEFPRQFEEAALRSVRAAWRWGLRKYGKASTAADMLEADLRSAPLLIAFAQASLLSRQMYLEAPPAEGRANASLDRLSVDAWALPLIPRILRPSGVLARELADLSREISRRAGPDAVGQLSVMIGQTFAFLNAMAASDQPSSILADVFYPPHNGKLSEQLSAPGTLYLLALLLHRQTGTWLSFTDLAALDAWDSRVTAVKSDLLDKPEGYLQLLAQELLFENFTVFMDQRGGRLRTIPFGASLPRLPLSLLPSLGTLLSELMSSRAIDAVRWNEFLAAAEAGRHPVPGDLQAEALPLTHPAEESPKRTRAVLAWAQKFNADYLGPQGLDVDIRSARLPAADSIQFNFFHIDPLSRRRLSIVGAGMNETLQAADAFGGVMTEPELPVSHGKILGIVSNAALVAAYARNLLAGLLRLSHPPAHQTHLDPDAGPLMLRWLDRLTGTARSEAVLGPLFGDHEWITALVDAVFNRLGWVVRFETGGSSPEEAFAGRFVQPGSMAADDLATLGDRQANVELDSVSGLFIALNRMAIAKSPLLSLALPVWNYESELLENPKGQIDHEMALFLVVLARTLAPDLVVEIGDLTNADTARDAVKHLSDLFLHPDMTEQRLRDAADAARRANFRVWLSLSGDQVTIHERPLDGAA